MRKKTSGQCFNCKKKFSPEKAGSHLLKCLSQSPYKSSLPSTGGYLIRISWAEDPNLYWMFVAVPEKASLEMLDLFLRNIWLECCGHLSEFMINFKYYTSHTESGLPSKSMKTKMSQLLSPDLEFDYTYDMGASTELELHVIDTIAACPQKEITLLMRNDPPPFSCAHCKNTPDSICSFCGETICSTCSKSHPCVINENDSYMLLPILNSPRTGVCGYDGT